MGWGDRSVLPQYLYAEKIIIESVYYMAIMVGIYLGPLYSLRCWISVLKLNLYCVYNIPCTTREAISPWRDKNISVTDVVKHI